MIFPKQLTHGLSWKIEIWPLFLLYTDLEIVFVDFLDGKKGFLDYGNIQFLESPY